MRPHVLACSVFLLGFAVLGGEGRTITKRQVKFGGAIDPGYEHHGDDAYRDKRKVEAKFGIKNAILGLVFHKINSFIDQKTAWVDQLDKTNIAKNKAHGIEPPKDAVSSISGIISNAIGSKLQAAGPIISLVTSKLAGGSFGSGGHHASSGGEHAGAGAGAGFNLGAFIGGGGGGAHASAGGYA